MWCVVKLNAEYVRKIEDDLAHYERGYDASAPVVCVDEKPATLHPDIRPPTPVAPGKLARRDNECKRGGTANAFCAMEPQAGRHFTRPTPRRTGLEFVRMAAQIVIAYPAAKTIHLVLDNLNIHCRKSLVGCYGEEFGDYLVDALRRPLHAQARQLAESGRDRNQHVLAPMSRSTPNPGSGYIAKPGAGLERRYQPRTNENQLAIQPQGRA